MKVILNYKFLLAKLTHLPQLVLLWVRGVLILWNFGKLLKDNFHATSEEKADAKKLENYYYEYFIVRVGAAPYRGFGSSVKKAATDGGNDGMAYRIHGCGLKDTGDEDTTFIVALESVLVLPK